MRDKIGGKIKTILFILGIVYFIVSRFYMNEKKKENAHDMKKRPVTRKTQDEIFRELQKSLNLPQTKHSSNVQDGPEHVKRTTLDRPKMTAKIKMRKPLKTNLNRKPMSQTSTLVKEEKTETVSKATFQTSQSELLTEFDARKAIIYSEILKRPQY